MKLNWLDWPMLAMVRPGTFGTAGRSAGSPPSNLSDIVALSFRLIVALSNDAVNVAASEVEVNRPTASRVRSARKQLGSRQCEVAADIAIRRSAAASPRRLRFVVPMHARKGKGAFDEPTHPSPLPGVEPAFLRLSVPLLGGARGGFIVPMHGNKAEEALHEPDPLIRSDIAIRRSAAASPRRLRFVVPMHARKGKGAFDEPTHPSPLPGVEPAFLRLSVPLLGGARGGFIVPMHGNKAEEALHEPDPLI